MANKRTYLDYNASAPLRPEARAAMLAAADVAGNPSSIHAEGRRARAIVEKAREQVAALVNARPEEVVFTSGGTEANNLAVSGRGPFTDDRQPLLYTSTIEHPSVLTGGGFDTKRESEYVVLPVLASGVIDREAFRAQLADDFEMAAFGHVFVTSFMLANNETGVIQPIRPLANIVDDACEALCSRQGSTPVPSEVRCHRLVHCDGVQAAGRIPIDLEELAVDLVTLSAHKIGGPRGVGALAGPGVRHFEGKALITGGGQERRRRAGTENVAGIAGFGAAAQAALRDLPDMARIGRMRDHLEREVKHITPEAVFVGQGSPRLSNTSCIALPGRKAETLVIALDLAGIAVSAGAACSSGKVTRSHVLQAMGLGDDIAGSAIRVSLGWNTREEDVAAFLAAWRTVAARPAKRPASAYM